MKAIKYIRRYIQMSLEDIIHLVGILLEAYLANHLGDHDLRSIQKTLAEKKFLIKIDLAAEAPRRRWMTGEYN